MRKPTGNKEAARRRRQIAMGTLSPFYAVRDGKLVRMAKVRVKPPTYQVFAAEVEYPGYVEARD